MNDYEIVKYRPEFQAQIIELLSPMWGSNTAVNTHYFEWKHCQNPYVDEPLFSLALHEGKVVGVRGFFGTQWQFGQPQQTIYCLADVDAIVLPDHRRQGLLTRMSLFYIDELKESKYKYCITLSANRFSSAAVIKLGWKNIGYFETAIRFKQNIEENNESINLVRRIGRKIPYRSSIYHRIKQYRNNKDTQHNQSQNPFYNLDKNYAQSQKEKHDFKNILIKNKPRSFEMADLISRIGSHQRIQRVRDHTYFDWRYNNPRSEYRFLFWFDTQLEGYLILQTRLLQPDTVTIVDWEATKPHVMANLLQAAIKFGEFDALSLWSDSLSMETKQILLESGFEIKKPTDDLENLPNFPHILIKSLDDDVAGAGYNVGNLNLLELSSWDLRAIYSDGY